MCEDPNVSIVPQGTIALPSPVLCRFAELAIRKMQLAIVDAVPGGFLDTGINAERGTRLIMCGPLPSFADYNQLLSFILAIYTLLTTNKENARSKRSTSQKIVEGGPLLKREEIVSLGSDKKALGAGREN